MNDQVILEKDLSSSATVKTKLMWDCFGFKLLQEKYLPVVIEERPERLAGTGDVDSDNGVDYSDKAVTNPFTKEELYNFQKRLKLLHLLYHNAKLASFQSARGKFIFNFADRNLSFG